MEERIRLLELTEKVTQQLANQRHHVVMITSLLVTSLSLCRMVGLGMDWA